MVHSRGMAGMMGVGGGAAGPMGGGAGMGGPGLTQSPVASTNAVPGGSGAGDPLAGAGAGMMGGGKRKRIKASGPKRGGSGNPFAKDAGSGSGNTSPATDARPAKNLMKRSTPKRF